MLPEWALWLLGMSGGGMATMAAWLAYEARASRDFRVQWEPTMERMVEVLEAVSDFKQRWEPAMMDLVQFGRDSERSQREGLSKLHEHSGKQDVTLNWLARKAGGPEVEPLPPLELGKSMFEVESPAARGKPQNGSEGG